MLNRFHSEDWLYLMTSICRKGSFDCFRISIMGIDEKYCMFISSHDIKDTLSVFYLLTMGYMCFCVSSKQGLFKENKSHIPLINVAVDVTEEFLKITDKITLPFP